MSVVVLPSVPGLGGLYARGAAAAARLAVARRAGRAPSSLPSVTYEVRGVRASSSALEAYQRLVGEPANDVIPAGYVHVLAFPVATALMVRPDFPLPLPGMVHLANRVTQVRPVLVSESLDVSATATGLRAHRSGTQLDLVVEVRVGDELVWRGVSTYLAKGVRLTPAGAPSGSSNEPAAPTASSNEPAPFVAPLPTAQWRLAADTGRRYAAVSGDRNPIHLSKLSAKALGFPRAIAHGMYTAARALAEVGAVRGDAFEWSVEFVKPVLLPGTAAVAIRREGDSYTVQAWNTRTGKPHLLSKITPR